LSCGMGKYCEESTDSLLGGLCEKVEQVSSSSRILDEGEGDYSAYYCDTLYCDCDLLDRETRTGKVVCERYTDCCAPDDSFCTSVTYTINLVNDKRWSWTGCYDFTDPYSRSVCSVLLGFSDDTIPGTCEWNIDGEKCTSCNVVTDDDGYYSTVFDCTNTGADMAIAGDSSEFGPLPIHDKFIDNESVMDCPLDPFTKKKTSKAKNSAANVSHTTAALICVLVSIFLSSLIGSY
jgi:hypothetical protein